MKRICPECGHENDADAKFCNNCGVKLPVMEETNEETKKDAEFADAAVQESEMTGDEQVSKDVEPVDENRDSSFDESADEPKTERFDDGNQTLNQQTVQSSTWGQDISNSENKAEKADDSWNGQSVGEDLNDHTQKSEDSEKPKKKLNKKILAIIGGVAALFIIIGVIASIPSLTSIKVEYDGNTEAGTVLDNNNDGIKVTAIYDDDSEKEVSDWNIEETEVLSNDTVSDVQVEYQGQTADLSVECSTSDPDTFEMSYDGDTAAGTVIDNNNDGLSGILTYKNGSTEDVSAGDIELDSAVTLEKDGTVTVSGSYKGITAQIKVTCSDKTITSLKAEYSGSTEEGTIIGTGNEDITVTAKYKDGSDSTVVDWTIDEPVVLEAGKKSTIKIKYQDASCDLKVQCTTMSEQQFKDSCKTVSFKDLARNPDDYTGKNYKFTGEVIQVTQEDGFYALRVNVTKDSYGYYDDTIMVYYTSEEGEPGILEEDIVNIYGISAGNTTYTAVLGQEVTLPLIYAAYIDVK